MGTVSAITDQSYNANAPFNVKLNYPFKFEIKSYFYEFQLISYSYIDVLLSAPWKPIFKDFLVGDVVGTY